MPNSTDLDRIIHEMEVQLQDLHASLAKCKVIRIRARGTGDSRTEALARNTRDTVAVALATQENLLSSMKLLRDDIRRDELIVDAFDQVVGTNPEAMTEGISFPMWMSDSDIAAEFGVTS